MFYRVDSFLALCSAVVFTLFILDPVNYNALQSRRWFRCNMTSFTSMSLLFSVSCIRFDFPVHVFDYKNIWTARVWFTWPHGVSKECQNQRWVSMLAQSHSKLEAINQNWFNSNSRSLFSLSFFLLELPSTINHALNFF